MEQEQNRAPEGEERALESSAQDRVCEEALRYWKTPGAISESNGELTSLGVRIFQLALLLVIAAFGVMLFLTKGEYWKSLSASVQGAIVFAPFIASYIGYFISRKRSWKLASQCFLFAGCGFFFFLASHTISTYSSWFNENVPHLWFFAAVTTFVAAFFSRNRALHGLAIFFIAVLLFFAMTDVPGCSPLFGDKGCFYLLPMIALGLYWSYRHASGVVGVAYYHLFVFWALAQFFVWNPHNTHYLAFPVIVMASAFALFSLFCRRAGIFQDGLPIFTYLIVLTALPYLTYGEFYSRNMGWSGARWQEAYSVLAAIGAGIGVLSAALLLRLDRRGAAPTRRSVLDVLLALFSLEGVWLAVLPLFLAFMLLFDNRSATNSLALIFAAYANVLMVGVALRYVWVGLKRLSPAFWFGCLYFVVWALVRVFSLASLFGVGATSLVVLFLGIVAIALFAAFYFLIRHGVLTRYRKNEEEKIGGVEEPGLREAADVVPEHMQKIGVRIAILLQFVLAFILPFC